MTTILLSAGDVSGEAHAAELVRVLARRDPARRFLGLGGEAMARAGVELVADAGSLAVGGLLELAAGLGGVARTWRAMDRALRRSEPDLVVLVDSGGFNLPFARRVRAVGRAPILYFVLPQVWAWRPGRVRPLAARADRLAVLLPFEQAFLARHGVEATCVGHPILDRPVAGAVPADARSAARARLGLDSEGPVLLMLPGSRRNEVVRNLPVQLAALARLRAGGGPLASLRGIVARAPSIESARLEGLLGEADEATRAAVRIVPGGLDAIDAADVALAKPGTGTLELMLRGRPMVVAARANPWTAAIVRRRIRVPWLAMPNLLAGEAIVPELLQADARPDRIAEAAAPLFGGTDPGAELGEGSVESGARAAQRAGFARARAGLGEPGAIERVAAIAEEMLGTPRT